jgi:hypothetical protein
MSKPRCKTASQIDFNAFWHYIKPKPDRVGVVHRSSGAASFSTSMGLGYAEPFPFSHIAAPEDGRTTLNQYKLTLHIPQL